MLKQTDEPGLMSPSKIVTSIHCFIQLGADIPSGQFTLAFIKAGMRLLFPAFITFINARFPSLARPGLGHPALAHPAIESSCLLNPAPVSA
jgi:hypothetical protein